jgi:hypothetical protein
MDPQGTFELNSVRAGLSDATVTMGVRSDVDDAVLDELAQTAHRTSAVYDSLVNPVPMRLHMQRLPLPADYPCAARSMHGVQRARVDTAQLLP